MLPSASCMVDEDPAGPASMRDSPPGLLLTTEYDPLGAALMYVRYGSISINLAYGLFPP